MPPHIYDAPAGIILVEIAVVPKIEEVSANASRSCHYDVGVYVAGYEERSAWYVTSEWCPRISESRWRHVEFTGDRDKHSAKTNLSRSIGELFGNRAAPRDWDGHWRQAWHELLHGEAKAHGRPINLLVDISSMPRAVYGALLVECVTSRARTVDTLTLVYVPGRHEGDMMAHRQVDGLRPLAGVEGKPQYDRGPALLIGLGYDGALADAVVDLFQIETYAAFYAKPGTAEVNVSRCESSNKYILSTADIVQTVPVNDVAAATTMILKLSRWYMTSHNVIIVPIGPKTHIVASLLASLIEPRIGFRCLQTTAVKPVQVLVGRETVPIVTRLTF